MKPDSLDILMKTSVPKTEEVIINDIIDLLGQDIIHHVQEVVTRAIPLFGRFLDESLRDNVQGVIRKFPRSRPIKS